MSSVSPRYEHPSTSKINAHLFPTVTFELLDFIWKTCTRALGTSLVQHPLGHIVASLDETSFTETINRFMPKDWKLEQGGAKDLDDEFPFKRSHLQVS